MSTKLQQLLISCLLLFSFISQSADGVLPQQKWKTFETEHFKVHYTPEFRDWAIAASHEMEASVEVIEESQNRKLPEKVDVVIMDPFNDSNGFALPFSTKPFMGLYTTPPQSDSIISNSSSWLQLLSLHEYVHLVHLAQPSRNRLTQALSEYWDLYDIAGREEINRWVAEGYATLQESRLTGRGRLYDAQVEALIRQFAREGALPKYSELNKTEGKYRIGSMAYLVGVRFLAWLEKNYSVEDLDAVWTRVQGKEGRTFEQAFEGIFLESPEYLYQRFIAEYTYEVMAEEKQLGKSESKLWYDAQFDLSSPVVDPEQKFLAFIETNKKRDSVIKVVNLAADDEQESEFEKAKKELLEEDPQDIAAKKPKVFNRKAEFKLQEQNFSSIRNLTWFDTDNIWFTAISRDTHGFGHQDIFQWNLSSGKVKQLTHQANLRRFDINSDGTALVAEHAKHGKSGLFQYSVTGKGNNVSVASSGELLTDFSMAHTYDFPRFNPSNNNQLVYLQSMLNQPWAMYLEDLTGKQGKFRIPMPEQYQFLSYPTWSKDGRNLYFVAGKGTSVKLYKFEFASQQLHEVTKGQELVSWPVALTAKDDAREQLLHVSMMSRGPELFARDLEPEHFVQVTEFTDFNDFEYLKELTDSEHRIVDAEINLDTSIGSEQDYDIWNQDITFTLSGTRASASYGSTEIGLKGSDILQRLSWNVSLMEASDDLESGYSANVAWQGWPIKLKAHAYQMEFSNTASNAFQQSYAQGSDRELEGYYLAAEYPYAIASSTYSGNLSISYLSNDSNIQDSQAIRLEHSQSWYMDKVNWGITQYSNLQVLSGETDINSVNDSWRGVQGSFTLSGHYAGFGLGVSYEHAERNDAETNLLQLGGIASGVLNQQAHANWLLTPELALGYATGNKYTNTQFNFYKRGSGWNLYYSEPKMEDQKLAEIVGIKGQSNMNMFGAGLSNIMIQYGLANVKPEQGEEEVEGWLSFRYQY